MDPTISLLRDLVAIDSVNPSLVSGAAGEHEIAVFIGDWLRTHGFDVHLDEVSPGRWNVVGVAEGEAGGPTRMLCGHTDTVGVEGMAAPFTPEIKDGRCYGRGAQDMKGGVAALLSAAAGWRASGGRGAGRVIVAGVADEEYASLGAEAVAARWQADEAVIPEPTDLKIGIAHKGFSCAEITVHGKAAHGSRPLEGRDAIIRMGRVLARLEALDHRLQSGRSHPLLGAASLHAGTIRGGTELSVYPAECVLQVERRTLPGEQTDVALKELTAIATEIAAADSDFTFMTRLVLARPPYATRGGASVTDSLADAVRARLGTRPLGGLSFWTDAAILAAAGTPTVLFGPRGAGLHSIEEYVEVEDVLACRDVFQSWLATSGTDQGRA
jgi:acetylornithine deacetylase/succinyl-diaminopimelate desuccinylase-like protein